MRDELWVMSDELGAVLRAKLFTRHAAIPDNTPI
jgi:hypothetical protein